MPTIRLLTSVAGDGPVNGTAGDELDVDAGTARTWADGERAELVKAPKPAKPARGTTGRRNQPETPERGRGESQATTTRPTPSPSAGSSSMEIR